LPELVIDGESGLIVPVDEREALGAAIKRVLADPQLASSLGMAGAKRIEQEFRWPKTAKRLLAIYQQALYQQELPQ
jgi:starch synthase